VMDDLANRRESPMKPQVIAHRTRQTRLREDAIVSCEQWTIATWWARHIPGASRPNDSSGNLATMAKESIHDCSADRLSNRQWLHSSGTEDFDADGRFRNRSKISPSSQDRVIKNNTLGQIKWEQMVFLETLNMVLNSNPSTRGVASSLWWCWVLPQKIRQCGQVLDEFLNVPGPALLQAVADPFGAAPAPKLRLDQRSSFAESLVRGEPKPQQRSALRQYADKVRELV